MAQPLTPLSQPLGSLGVNQPPVTYAPVTYGGGYMDGFGFYLVWFLIIAVVAWIVLFSLKPDFVRKADGELDAGKVLLWAVIIGLIGIFIIWLVKKCNRVIV